MSHDVQRWPQVYIKLNGFRMERFTLSLGFKGILRCFLHLVHLFHSAVSICSGTHRAPEAQKRQKRCPPRPAWGPGAVGKNLSRNCVFIWKGSNLGAVGTAPGEGLRFAHFERPSHKDRRPRRGLTLRWLELGICITREDHPHRLACSSLIPSVATLLRSFWQCHLPTLCELVR